MDAHTNHTPHQTPRKQTRPTILQWNCNSLRRRHAELYETLLTQQYDILCLQETYTLPDECRLPGYVAYNSATECKNTSCLLACCYDATHPPGRARATTYVRRTLPHALVDLAGFQSSLLECVAIIVRMGAVETTVINAYVPPEHKWDPAELCSINARCRGDRILCGDLNAHHPSWGSARASTRGNELVDAIGTCGLASINTGETTFTRKGSAQSCLDVTFVSDHCGYRWKPQASSWGSDHKPIVITPHGTAAQHSRTYSVVHWDRFRQLLDERGEGDFIDALMHSLRAATRKGTAAPCQPTPDLKLLNLRAARQRAQRRALRTNNSADWTQYNRLDAALRRHAKKMRRESWAAICASLESAGGGARAWRLLRALTQPPSAGRQPLLSLAIERGKTAAEIAEAFAQHLSAAAPPAPAQNVNKPAAASCAEPNVNKRTGLGAAALDARVEALMNDPFTIQELNQALARAKRKSAPGLDGITFQSLRNLNEGQRAKLLAFFNELWERGALPDTFTLAVICPILKPGKGRGHYDNYRPISLTSAAGKLLEMMVLARLEWLSYANNWNPEQQTGFRCGRSTQDSIVDVVSSLEQAKGTRTVLFLVLLDVEKAFDRLPHSAINTALDGRRVSGRLRTYLHAFLNNRRMCVRVAKSLSTEHQVTAGVPQGSVLSPFLFNLALAALPECLPHEPTVSLNISIYADDVALWCSASTARRAVARNVMQHALNRLTTRLAEAGLSVSPSKTVALMYHPTAGDVWTTTPLTIGGNPLPWQKKIRYLGVTIDHRLTWTDYVRKIRDKITEAQRATRKLVAGGRGCTPDLAVRIYQATGVSHVMYALPLAKQTDANWKKLEVDHNNSLRMCLGIPKYSNVAATLAEAGTWPLKIKALRVGLNFVARLKLAPDGSALLERIRARRHSHAAHLLTTYEQLVGTQSASYHLPPPPNCDAPIAIVTTIPGIRSKRGAPACALQQEAAGMLHEHYGDRLHVYTDGSVIPGPPKSATAACVAPQLGLARACKLSFASSSTTAELAGLHLAADSLLQQEEGREPAVILCDSKAALSRLQRPAKSGPLVANICRKFEQLKQGGRDVCLQWVPSHVGLRGNELADDQAKAAHTADTPIFEAATKADEARYWVYEHTKNEVPEPSLTITGGQPWARIPSRAFCRSDCSLLYRLRTGCAMSTARRHLFNKQDSPDCQHCSQLGNTEHALLHCSLYASERAALRRTYANLLVPCSTKQELLFPPRPRVLVAAYKALLCYLHSTGLASLL